VLNEERLYLDRLGSDWVLQRHILREYGVIVSGPDLRGLIDPVAANELRNAVIDVLQDWWAPMLDDPSFLERDAYQVYAVLTMCRAWHTLKSGTITTKPKAARWALARADERRRPLIQLARAWAPGLSFQQLPETLDFTQQTIARTRRPPIERAPDL
jgi:hypothetical protein